MVLDHRERHDVEDTAGVRVFRVGQFLVASPPVVSRLNLAVDLSAISAIQINTVFPVRANGGSNTRVGGLFFRHLFNVEPVPKGVFRGKTG